MAGILRKLEGCTSVIAEAIQKIGREMSPVKEFNDIRFPMNIPSSAAKHRV
jgi:hypothetical protein